MRKPSIKTTFAVDSILNCNEGFSFVVEFNLIKQEYPFASPYDEKGDENEIFTSKETDILLAIEDVTSQIEKRAEKFKKGWEWSADIFFDSYLGVAYKN